MSLYAALPGAIARRLQRHRPSLTRAAAGSPRCMAAGSPQEVYVSEDGARFAHTLQTGRHTLRGDLMPQAGGTDVGPSPKELAMLRRVLFLTVSLLLAERASLRLHPQSWAVHFHDGAHLCRQQQVSA